ncbi:hypothetical protein E2562_030265 [Oryza meyeriana var. granulata]|uniref:Uncharacterized protein n=1 Tax=Oryza meyeriana var. granulata TaxID=110450 RepID=A0A6G1D9B1_9ORYZ|nr:hypothetical protein E2562_030265 [Oryza meyeriana var. granulata]
MKKTCHKRKVDSNDGDEPATKKLKSLNWTNLKSFIDECAALSPTHVQTLTDLHFDGILRMTLEGSTGGVSNRPVETPRIQFYTKEIVKSILKLDRDPADGTYGCVSAIEGTCYYHDDFDREVEPRGGNHGNPWPEELRHLDAIYVDQQQAFTEALQRFDNQTRQFARDIEQWIMHVQEGSWSIFPTPSFCMQPPKVLYQEA